MSNCVKCEFEIIFPFFCFEKLGRFARQLGGFAGGVGYPVGGYAPVGVGHGYGHGHGHLPQQVPFGAPLGIFFFYFLFQFNPKS